MSIFIKHIQGSKNEEVETFDQDYVRIGRQPDNDLKFDPKQDVSVSGYHAEIYRDGEIYFIKDLQSRNGTFANSRKITRPVRLKEGDVLQFSARGPKVVFSTRDPSVDDSVAALADAPGGEATQVFTSVGRDKAEKGPDVWQRIKPAVPMASAGLVLIALVGIGRYLDFSWWALLIGAAVIVPAAGGAYLGWGSWQRRKVHTEREEAEREERAASLEGGHRNELHDLRRKWTEMVRSLKNSKLQRLADDPIYALPWFVVLGEPGSGKSTLIKASGPFSSVVTPGQEGPTRNCDWWFFDKTLILDTTGRYVFQAKASESAKEWHELLNLLRNNRQKEPINGVLITLPADSLASKPVDKLKEEAAQLRERIDEMVQRLGVKFPVYVIISKCDLIAGFTEFFEALPDRVKSQALGSVNSDLHNSDASRFFDRAYRTLCERAQRLRLALLSEEVKSYLTRGTFLFPAELQCLHAPLKAYVDVLFRPSPYRDTPLFRGLFLASARQSGSPLSPLSRTLGSNYVQLPPAGTTRDFFLRDIFAEILPNDRALVGHTAVTRERYQLTRAAGLIIAVAASLLVSGLFLLSFTNNWSALTSLDMRPCLSAGDGKGAVGQVLRPLDECRQSIDDLVPRSILGRIAFDFGLGEASRVGNAMKSRFLGLFRASVMNPLDNRIDDSLAKRSGASFVVGAILKRLDLLARCQESGSCGDMEKSDGINYRVLLTLAEPRIQEGDPGIDRLRRGYESYLLWQTDPKIYAAMYDKDLERLNSWVRGGLDEKSVLESAKSQFPSINAADIWGVTDPLRVDAAYTARAWREGIDPLVSGLRKFASQSKDVSDSVRRFEVNYRDEALRQWGEFLGEFPRLEKLAFQSGITPQRALIVAGPDSPYARVIDMVHANLSVILGSSWEATDLPSWVVTLKKYVALRSKIAEMQKAGKPVSEEKGSGKEPGFLASYLPSFSQRQQRSVSEEKDLSKHLGFLATYVDALGQLKVELSSSANSYESSKKAFAEGGPSEKATHPILKASWAHRMLRRNIGSVNEDDGRFWILLERPVVLGWQAMLGETGKYLQQQWETLRGEVIGQEDFRTGTDKMYAFATRGPAAAFLDEQGRRWVRKPLLDQSVPFREEFLDYLFRYRLYSTQGSPSLTALVPPPPAFIVRTS